MASIAVCGSPRKFFDIAEGISPAEASKLLGSEIRALRQTAESCGDEQTMIVLDFLGDAEGDSRYLLEIALQESAALAVASGLTERVWTQQFLDRYAAKRETLDSAWHALVNFRMSGSWPWVERSAA